MCARSAPTWPAAAIYAVLLIGGFFRSLQFTAYNTLAYGDVPRARMSAATSLYTAAQQLASHRSASRSGALALEVSMLISRHATPVRSDFSAGVPRGGGCSPRWPRRSRWDAAQRRRRPDRPALGVSFAPPPLEGGSRGAGSVQPGLVLDYLTHQPAIGFCGRL